MKKFYINFLWLPTGNYDCSNSEHARGATIDSCVLAWRSLKSKWFVLPLGHYQLKNLLYACTVQGIRVIRSMRWEGSWFPGAENSRLRLKQIIKKYLFRDKCCEENQREWFYRVIAAKGQL